MGVVFGLFVQGFWLVGLGFLFCFFFHFLSHCNIRFHVVQPSSTSACFEYADIDKLIINQYLNPHVLRNHLDMFQRSKWQLKHRISLNNLTWRCDAVSVNSHGKQWFAVNAIWMESAMGECSFHDRSQVPVTCVCGFVLCGDRSAIMPFADSSAECVYRLLHFSCQFPSVFMAL